MSAVTSDIQETIEDGSVHVKLSNLGIAVLFACHITHTFLLCGVLAVVRQFRHHNPFVVCT